MADQQRTRSFDNSTSHHSSASFAYANGNTVDYEADFLIPDTALMHDIVCESFLTRVRNGGFIMNGADRVSEVGRVIAPVSGTIRAYRKTTGVYYGSYNIDSHPGFVVSTLATTYPWMTDNPVSIDGGHLVNTAWANLNSSEFLSLAWAGELPDLFRYAKTLARRSLRLFRKLEWRHWVMAQKRINDPVWRNYSWSKYSSWKIKDLPRDMRDFWMETRYSIRPLMYDWSNLVTAINRWGASPRIRGFGTEEPVTHTRDLDLTDYATYGTSIYGKRRVRIVDSARSIAGAYADIRAGACGNIIHNYGLLQLIPSAWELTRLSFVVDWFLDVGELLSAWCLDPALEPLGAFLRQEHTKTVYTYVDWSDPYSGLYYDWRGDVGTAVYQLKQTSWSRIANPPRSLLAASYFDKMPSLAHVADILSLISQIKWRGVLKRR